MTPDPSAPAPQVHSVVSNRPLHTHVRTIDFVATQFLLRLCVDPSFAKLHGAASKIMLVLVSNADELTADGNLLAELRPIEVMALAGIGKSAWNVSLRELIRRDLVLRHDPPYVHDPVLFELVSGPNCPLPPRTTVRGQRAGARGPRAVKRYPRAPEDGPRTGARGPRAPEDGPRAPEEGAYLQEHAGADARGRPALASASSAAEDRPAAAAAALEAMQLPAARVRELAALEHVTPIVIRAAHLDAGTRRGLLISLIRDPSGIDPRFIQRATRELAPRREAAPPAAPSTAQQTAQDAALAALTDAQYLDLRDAVLRELPANDRMRPTLERLTDRAATAPVWRSFIYAQLLAQLAQPTGG